MNSIYMFVKYKWADLKQGFFFLLRSSKLDWRFLYCLHLSLDLMRCKNVKGFAEQTTCAKLLSFVVKVKKEKNSRIDWKIGPEHVF